MTAATRTFRPATDRTLAFLRTLLAERETPIGMDEELLESMGEGVLSQREASDAIDVLKDAPRKQIRANDVAGEPIVTEGVFELDGKVFRTKKARAGHLYFQVFNFDSRKYEYAAGGTRFLREHNRITLERAIELSAGISSCIRCNRRLTNPTSVERSIGPICRTYFI